jgi:hypothetical protein
MQNQLESADRPWLKITGAMPAAPLFYHVPYVLTPGLDFVNTGIKVTFENVGHSVAFDVTTRAQMVLVKPLNGAENDYFEESGRKAEGGKRDSPASPSLRSVPNSWPTPFGSTTSRPIRRVCQVITSG